MEIHLGQVPIADLRAPPPLTFEASGLARGGTVERTITVINASTVAPLTLEPPSLDGAAAFELVGGETGGHGVALDEAILLRPSAALVLTLRYRSGPAESPTASLRLRTDTRLELERDVLIPLTASVGAPVLDVTPASLDFRRVGLGETKTLTLRLSNTGSAPLTVSSLTLGGSAGFSVSAVDQVADDSGHLVFDPPLVVAGGGFEVIEVRFAPTDPNPATGTLSLETDADAATIPLTANASVPCLVVAPDELQFGAKLVGTKAVLPVELRACGSAEVRVEALGLTGDGAMPFAIAASSLPTGRLPTEDDPLVIPAGGALTLNVEYVPDHESAIVDGEAVLDEAVLEVLSDAFEPKVERLITGRGATSVCPVAVGRIAEGEQVIPQTRLHLDSSGSFAMSGSVASRRWSVVQPLGSVSVFVPSAEAASVTFDANVAGQYEFRLDVADEAGTPACSSWSAKLLVVPDEAIHVELLWNTPNDTDETDEGAEAGSDVDLHFVDLGYVGATDPWFDPIWDTFWFNAHPNWGAFSPAGFNDPSLDRDDTDGGGPENLNLAEPQDGHQYLVGVHYWNSHGFGDAYATVRIYIWHILVAEFADVRLTDLDMWCVATIDWPSGKVTACPPKPGDPWAITPNYTNAYFIP